MKRLGLALLYGAGTAAFAISLHSPAAWAGVALALASLLVHRRFRLEAPALRRVLYAALAGMAFFGWLLRAFPILSSSAMLAWTLGLGYAIAGLGGLYLFSARALERTVIPAAAGCLTIASFEVDAPIQPCLLLASLGAFLYLAADILPRPWPAKRARRTTLLAVLAAAAAGVGAGIVVLLPVAQQRVEDAMVALYTTDPNGIQGQYRSQLGELQRLKLSKKVVMRVWSERPQRLRARVLVGFDGRGWSRDPAAIRVRDPDEAPLTDAAAATFLSGLPGADFLIENEAARETPDRGWIRTRVVRVDGRGLVTPGGSFLVRAPLDYVQVDNANVVFPPPSTRLRSYGVLHAVNHQRAQLGPISDAVRQATLELPEAIDPRIQALADELAEGAGSDEAVAERVVAHLREHYAYSLDIGSIDTEDPVADFLFDKGEGWCEYFATSAALLMRVRGIPTRYVRGYNVIGSQRVGDHYVVRDWDRHAWVEAYIEGKGWLEYDPTPPAEYESLHASLEHGALRRRIEWLRGQLALLYVSVRELEPMDLVRPALWLVGLFVVGRLSLDLFVAWRSRQGRSQTRTDLSETSELDHFVAALDRALERLGHPRPESRAPLEHWSRLPRERLPAELQAEGRRLLDAYYAARFGSASLSPGDREAFRALTAAVKSQAEAHS